MHENNFEKRVREKMDDLGFDPSDAVWAAVDKEINKEKKRRRPLFWIFFFSGLVLAGGGFYLTAVNHHSNKIINPEIPRGAEIKKESQSGNPVEINKQKQLDDLATGKISARENDKKSRRSADGQTQNFDKIGLTDMGNIPPGQQVNSGLNEKVSKDPTHLPPAENVISGTGELETNKKADSSVVNKEISPDQVKTSPTDSAIDGKMTVKKNQQKKSDFWKIGFTGSAGVSNINQSLFKSINAADPNNLTAYPAGGYTGSGGRPYGSANINAGFAYGVGVFISRNLSKRFSISAGLNYRYYSTKINTGNKVDSFIYVYAAAFQSATAVTSYYRSAGSNSYINQYHFVELPVTAGFQLNKSMKTPVIWEAGLSFAYLVSSNALQYDPAANVYFKNNGLLNKAQLNAETAILAGFHLHHSEMRLGPQVQYGLTGLLKGSNASPQHLFYYGLKFSIIPGKK